VKLIVSRAAAADVVRLRTFLAERDNRVAQRVTIALDTAVRSLKDFPERGRPSGLVGARDLNVPFGQSSYVLRYVYSAEADEIIILRIWHGRELRE
jgi:plasmid stabilization system protein ParE